jgi:hypothetical protein
MSVNWQSTGKGGGILFEVSALLGPYLPADMVKHMYQTCRDPCIPVSVLALDSTGIRVGDTLHSTVLKSNSLI